MIRAIGAFVTVILASAAGAGYMALFYDEIDPRAAANVGAGALAPMYRHWVEFVLVIWTTFLGVAVSYYWMLGPRSGIQVDWPKVRHVWLWLHLVSGSVVLTGLLIAVAAGQPVHFRDLVTVLVGVGLLAMSMMERMQSHVRKF